MAPEPEPFADLMADALQRIARGEDVGQVLIDKIREAYDRGRRDERDAPGLRPASRTITTAVAPPGDGPPTKPYRVPKGTLTG